MNIRKYKNSDHEELVKLWRQVFPNDPPHNEPETVIPAKLDVDDLIIVAQDNNKIIGACMAGYDGHRGWLYAVAVDTQYRRTGVGSALVQYTLNTLKALGCIKTNLQIRTGNHKVESFYKTLGFKAEERISMGKLL